MTVYDLQSRRLPLQSAFQMVTSSLATARSSLARTLGTHNATPGARTALYLLLVINLFNYIDRQVLAALEPLIRDAFFSPTDRNAMFVSGWLGSAFLLTYMLSAPALGFLADRFSRWLIIGVAVILWSMATFASGLAPTFTALMLTRVLVGIGEGGYGPAAPTLLADLFPITARGRILAIFCAAIPVGSALGYAIGGTVAAHLGWRWAFYLVAPPGLLLGIWCFFQRDPRVTATGERPERHKAHIRDYLHLARIPSYVFNCGAQTAMTFAVGGIGFWAAAYLKYRGQPATATAFFGGIVALAGLLSTLFGGWLGDKLRDKYPGSYFLVSGVGIILAVPLFVAMLFTPFPFAWALMFFSIFFMFINTGPSNTAIANVSLPKIRATAFALNILIIHLLGDVLAFPSIGYVAGHSTWTIAFLCVAGVMLLSGVLWLIGSRYLAADTAAVERAVANP